MHSKNAIVLRHDNAWFIAYVTQHIILYGRKPFLCHGLKPRSKSIYRIDLQFSYKCAIDQCRRANAEYHLFEIISNQPLFCPCADFDNSNLVNYGATISNHQELHWLWWHQRVQQVDQFTPGNWTFQSAQWLLQTINLDWYGVLCDATDILYIHTVPYLIKTTFELIVFTERQI